MSVSEESNSGHVGPIKQTHMYYKYRERIFQLNWYKENPCNEGVGEWMEARGGAATTVQESTTDIVGPHWPTRRFVVYLAPFPPPPKPPTRSDLIYPLSKRLLGRRVIKYAGRPFPYRLHHILPRYILPLLILFTTTFDVKFTLDGSVVRVNANLSLNWRNCIFSI